MFLYTLAANRSSERSFSTLRRSKTYLRLIMNNDRLNAMAVLNTEIHLASSINYTIIQLKNLPSRNPGKQFNRKLKINFFYVFIYSFKVLTLQRGNEYRVKFVLRDQALLVFVHVPNLKNCLSEIHEK